MGNDERGFLSKRALLWAAGILGGLALPTLRSGDVAGVSRLMAISYLVGTILLTVRHLLHAYENYYRVGLARSMLLELTTLIAWGGASWILVNSANPQFPRLAIFASGGTALYFICTTKMEGDRAALLEAAERRGLNLEIRRATDVIRESRLWLGTCKRFRRLDFELARKVRRLLAGPDTPPGMLSLVAGIAFAIQLVVTGASTALVMVSVIAPIEITPESPAQSWSSRHPQRGGSRQGNPPDDEKTHTEGGSSLAAECGVTYKPGAEVPEPERSALVLAWQEVPDVPAGPMEALGFEAAGCPRPARPLPGNSGSWYALGYCGSDLQSIAIAPRGLDHPVVALEQAAEFALPFILNGEYVSAVDRFHVGTGDAYIIDTKLGSYVLVRDQTTGGPVKDEVERDGGCGGYADEDVRYAIVGPGLIEAWRAVAAISLGGVYPIDYVRQKDGSETVVFRSPDGIVGEGLCSIPHLMCRIDIGGNMIEGRRGTFITKEEVEALVEP